jgi:hypothetical protein
MVLSNCYQGTSSKSPFLEFILDELVVCLSDRRIQSSSKAETAGGKEESHERKTDSNPKRWMVAG